MKKMKKMKIKITSFIMTMLFSVQAVYATSTPPTKPSDVKAYNDLTNLVGFGMLVVAAAIVLTAGIRWGILNFQSMHEEDPAKLSELDGKKRKLIKSSVLGLSGSIVTAILAFFV